MHVVIVGNGIAGMEAALTLRQRDAEARITLVSEESDHFFSRTALMYVLCGQMCHRDIEPLERGTYERLSLERVRARVTAVDPERRVLQLSDKLPPLSYDRLLIACGSRPRPTPFWPGYGELEGIGHFVTLQDLAWLETELHLSTGHDRPPREWAHLEHTTDDSPYQRREAAATRRGTRARTPVVIGGGLIGVEVVETLLSAGLSPTFLIREDWFWPIALDERESTWIADRMRHHGVDVRLGESVQRFEGTDGRISGVLTDQGGHDADLVVIAIGVVPNTGWLEGSGIERDSSGGILVDEQLKTSAQGVWAAGDCASVRWFNGWVRPEQLWYTGRDQGRLAARAILGDEVRYARGTWYNSAKLMDIEYTTAGLVNMGVEGEASWFFEERGRVRSTTRIVHVGGRVVGFNFLGRRWDHDLCVRWIEERRPLSWVLDHLDEARFDTELVPPLRIPASARSPVASPP
ncbi:MAG TPA: FAD-dependent oxidoreductase [Deltaproteobacteria bacterium]|nr:FAD-dependent oxidoreductase [Deltaproteobacteria bacterium]